jgi:hypothetical protein
MKYLITNYKGHDIYYNDKAPSWDAFESANIKKENLTDVKVAIELTSAGEKYNWLSVVANFSTPDTFFFTKAHSVKVDGKEYRGNLNYFWPAENEVDEDNCYLIPNTKENLALIKRLKKELVEANKSINLAYKELSKYHDKARKELKDAS